MDVVKNMIYIIFKYIYTYIYIYIYTRNIIYIYIYVCVIVCVCIYSIYIYIYHIFIYLYFYVSHTHMYIYIYIYHTHIYVHIDWNILWDMLYYPVWGGIIITIHELPISRLSLGLSADATGLVHMTCMFVGLCLLILFLHA